MKKPGDVFAYVISTRDAETGEWENETDEGPFFVIADAFTRAEEMFHAYTSPEAYADRCAINAVMIEEIHAPASMTELMKRGKPE